MDRDLDLSLRMTERYLWAHSVMHHHNELNVTKELVTGSCITRSVMLHPVTNSFGHIACKAYKDVHYREGSEIPLRQSE